MAQDKIFEICSTLIATPLSFLYVYILAKDWRYSRWKTRAAVITVLAALLILDLFICIEIGMTDGRNIITVSNFAALTILYLFLLKYQGGRALFICFSVALFMLVGAAAAEIFGTTVPINRLLIKCAVYLILLVIIYRLFRRPFFVVMEGIEKGWHRLAAIPITFCILLIAVLWSGDMYHDTEMKMIGMALCFAVCVIYMVLYYAFCNLQEQYRIKSGYDVLQSQMHSLQRQLEIVRESGKELDILRHDMRHYIMLLSACVENGDLDEAKKLMKSFEVSLDSVNKKNKKYTGNILIDSILGEYESRFEMDNINFEAMISLPETLRNNPIEFAVVISNALENAYAACGKIPQKQERTVKIKGRMEKGKFFLEIANTFIGEIKIDKETGRPLSAQEGHGYGTQSIAAFAEKNHAYLQYKAENGWFRLRLIL